ncbi:hypothetical protein ACU6DI_004127 [Vibrio navarrensis]|nr:hypothetical protein [Vibrio parahaemolyticus]HDY7736035.1 hypothetical protein [Vibrio vulnificus]
MLFNGFLFLLFFGVIVYGFFSENTYNQTKRLIALGALVCFCSWLFMGVIDEALRVKIVSKGAAESFKDLITITMAALGGGLMSSGFILSAQKKFNIKNQQIRDSISNSEKKIKDIQDRLDAYELVGENTDIQKLKQKLADVMCELDDQQETLKERSYL